MTAIRTMPAIPEWLRADATGRPIGVDRQAQVIRGYVVAQRGPFKTPGRGEFDDHALDIIVGLMNQKPPGTKSRFTHPGMSDDGLGKFLGRSREARIDGDRVRADLHLDPSASITPDGNLADYVMTLAENDPEAFGSSLVLRTKKEVRLEADGTAKKDAKGEPLPPLWRPTHIHASDVVDEGDAVHDGFLSLGADGVIDLDELPDTLQRKGWEWLDRLFTGQPRETTEARCLEYLRKYLDRRYGTLTTEPATVGSSLDTLRRRLRLRELAAK